MKFQEPEVVELGLAQDLIKVTYLSMLWETILIPELMFWFPGW